MSMKKSELSIKESRTLAFSRDGMSSNELKILGLALLKFQDIRDFSKPVTVNFKEFKQWTGQKSANYTYFKKSVLKAYDAKMEFEFEDGRWEANHVFNKIEGYYPKKGEDTDIKIFLKEELKEIILPQTKYTPIGYAYMCQLQGRYSVRLYRGLHTKYFHLNKRNTAFMNENLDKFRKWLGITDTYKRIGHLTSRILTPACAEISKKTDITVQYELLGTPTNSIRFTIQKNPHPELDKLYLEPIQTGFFSELDDLKKIWTPERLADHYSKAATPSFGSKNMAFKAKMAKEHGIDVDQVDGRWELVGKSEEPEPERQPYKLSEAQESQVKQGKDMGYPFKEGWLYWPDNEVKKEVGEIINWLKEKQEPKKKKWWSFAQAGR